MYDSTPGQITRMEDTWRYYRQASIQPIDSTLITSTSWRLYAPIVSRSWNITSYAKYDYRYWYINDVQLYSSSDCTTGRVDTSGATFDASNFDFRTLILHNTTRGYEPNKAFDSYNSTAWVGLDNFWIQAVFDNPVTVKCVRLTQDTSERYYMKSVILQALDAASVWKPVVQATGLIGGTSLITNTGIAVPQPAPTLRPTSSDFLEPTVSSETRQPVHTGAP
jgi:hypothetical protein